MKIKLILAATLAVIVSSVNAQTTKPKAPQAAKPKTTAVKPAITKPELPLDRSVRPKAAAAPIVKIGNPQKFELANGIQLFVVENHKVPKISASLILNLDPIMEGSAKGFVDLTGQLMKRGTKSRTKEQLDTEIDQIGANINTNSNGGFASGLSKYKEKVFELFADVMLNPSFPADELEKLKEQTISGLQQQKDDADAIAENVMSKVIYGSNHPYGEVTTEASVKNVTAALCNNYYSTFFRPNVAYLAIVGDITPTEAKAMVEKYFGKWQKADVPKFTYPMPTPAGGVRVAFAQKPGAVQSQIHISHTVNLKNNSADLIKARVADNLLGGGSTARLFLNLREKHGWTYGAYSDISPNEVVGSFDANALVRNNVTDSAVAEFLNEMTKMSAEKVSDAELKNMLSYMTGTFALSTENPSTIANFAINSARYNLPADYYANYLKNLNAVTVDDIQNVSAKYITPKNCFIVVVGSKDVIENLKPFATSGKVEMYDYQGNPVKEGKPMPAGITAEKVINNYIAAIGGEKNLDKVKDYTIKYGGSLQGMALEMVMSRKAPNKYAMVVGGNGMVFQKITFDGVKGVQSGMQGAKELKDKELADLSEQAIIFNERNYIPAKKQIKLAGLEEVDGKPAYVLEVGEGDKKTLEYYDQASGLKVQEVATREVQGETSTQTTKFSDYKDVEGIKFPYTMSVGFGPMSLDMKATEVLVNKKLKDDIFKQ